jgi:TetR/AcrR family transcriptional regulator
MASITAQSRDTRERLIEAARELMIEHGILEVSLSEITQRAGVNVALVSYHFGGREGLMLSIAEGDAAFAIAELSRLRSSNLRPSEMIRAHVTGIINAFYRRPYLNRLLQKLLREGSPDASRQVSEFFVKPVAEARNGIISEGIACGEFRPVDPSLFGYALEGACSQIFTSAASRQAILGNGSLDQNLVNRYAASTADLIVNGLLRSSADDPAKGDL